MYNINVRDKETDTSTFKNYNNMKTMVYTISATNISTEECDFDCKETYEIYYSVDKAISAAIDVAKELSDNECVYNVSVFGGEYQDDKGNILGEPYDIYTYSNKDKETTISTRLNSGYVKGEVDGYITNGEFEFEDKNFKL